MLQIKVLHRKHFANPLSEIIGPDQRQPKSLDELNQSDSVSEKIRTKEGVLRIGS
jgi:hypothetical protein